MTCQLPLPIDKAPSSARSPTSSPPIPHCRFLAPNIFFFFGGDLHVHSDDTVGTNSTTYNFSYAQNVARLDMVVYTANDFNVTKQRWDATLEMIKKTN